MIALKKIWKLLWNKYFLQKLIAYLLLIGLFYILQDFLLVIFLTFIFAYLFLTFWSFLKEKFDQFIKKILRNEEWVVFLQNFFSLNIIIIFLYLIFIGTIFFALSDLVPELIRELRELPRYIPALQEPITMVTSKLEEIKNINSQIGGSMSDIFTKQDIDLILQVLDKIKAFWAIFLKVIIALILSYIFIIDREKLSEYLQGMKQSNFWFLYHEYKIIIEKIVRTFGLVFKAQSMIALTNMVLTTLGLLIIWWIHGTAFPLVYTLAIIVFICGFIPVLGTFISSFPILLIGYNTYPGFTILFEIVFLISFIHAVEAYYLNPKIVSSYIKLPLSLTFLVLILSEHFMGFAWLIIWISSFYLILELLRDTDNVIAKSKLVWSDMNEVEKQTKESLKKDIRVSRKIDE